MNEKPIDNDDDGIDDGGSAFPQSVTINAPAGQWASTTAAVGMSLRDYFATKAMQALLTGDDERRQLLVSIAYDAYRMADVMLAVRTKAGKV